MPGIGVISSFGGKKEGKEIFFDYSSFTDPGSIYRIDTDTYKVEKWYSQKLSPDSPNLDDFTTDRVMYPSLDGVKVPMFVVRKKSVLATLESKPEKPIPTLIYSYGGYGLNMNPHFSNSLIVWMNNMNGIYVLA
jgi:prolyl oligopeptidase